MSNLSFLSFNRAVSDNNFTEMLSSVVNDNYSEHYKVLVEEHLLGCRWLLQPKEGIVEEVGMGWKYSLFITRASEYQKTSNKASPCKDKFSHKHMGAASYWGYWFSDQIHGHMSAKYGAVSSGERPSVTGTWQIDPKECLSVSDWIRRRIGDYLPQLLTTLSAVHTTTPERLLEIQG